jgi:N-acetyl-alpha-D-muramate 1-phosphate uridylyltransferase
MLPVVILAGGLATRLYPVTQKIPKSLIKINGIPFISHQLSLLKAKGITRVVICVGKFGKEIESYVKNGSVWGLDIQYSYDGETLLGTGGAIKKAIPLLPDAFFIMYGDSYLDIDYSKVEHSFLDSHLSILITIYHNNGVLDKSNIQMKDGKIIKYDKISCDPEMEFIDFGLIIIKKNIFNEYPENKLFDLSILLTNGIKTGDVSPYVVYNRFFEIGSPQGILDTEEYIQKHSPCYESGIQT